MKKFLSLVLALVMTMSLVTVSAGAKDFEDNDVINYAEAVAVMSDVKVVDGYADGSFKPANNLTRQAAAKIICNMILGPTTAAALRADTAPYKDVPVSNEFAGYITYCAQQGIISGYADGEFKPTAPLTGYAFMKMLLGALGYAQDVEGYVGPNWSVNVAKRALGIGLNAGLKDSFNGVKVVTREEAALYAFNTLKATMVDYDSKTTVNVGGAEVVISGSAAEDVANNARTEGIKDDNKLQFAEKYFTKLSVSDAEDVFGRPCNKWMYNKDEIGTFVDYTLLVEEYTTTVTGKELYDVVGGTAYEDYDFAAYVDGKDSDLCDEISKNNKAGIEETGNGALTQVFVNNDTKNGDVIVTVINTYLAKANGDYNAKKDSVSFNVYGTNDTSATVYGEEFDIEDVKEGDFALVTYDAVNKEIVTISDVEIIDDTEIERFTTGSSVTIDGEKYGYNQTATYDAGVLDKYTGIDSALNLRDITYNVYLDQYGYVIGIAEVTAPTNFLFITGADAAQSNLTNKTWSANAIFLDGTSEVIEVKTSADVKDTAIINKWFSYTVNKNGVYTVELVNEKQAVIDTESKFDVAQSHVNEGDSENGIGKIDSKHYYLNGIGSDAKVYGNDNTVYLHAELDKITHEGNDYAVITGADEVVTGIDNASFITWGWAKVAKETETVADRNGANTSWGTYVLYGDNGYVIAAVVVGESGATSSKTAYVISDDVSSETLNKAEGTWTWTRDVVIGGELVELVETNDTGVSVLEEMDFDEWVVVKYYADGTVKAVEACDELVNKIADAADAVEADDEFIVLDSMGDKRYALEGRTLFDVNDRNTGLRVAEDVKIVLTQVNKNQEVTTYDEGISELKATLNDLNEVKGVSYWFDAVIENGRVTAVIINDRTFDNDYEGPDGKPVAGYEAKVDTLIKKVTVSAPEAWEKDKVTASAVAALADEGYEVTKMSFGDPWVFTAKNVKSGTDGIEFTITLG